MTWESKLTETIEAAKTEVMFGIVFCYAEAADPTFVANVTPT